MKIKTIVVLGCSVLACLLSPATAANLRPCETIGSFQNGCLQSGGAWSQVFRQFADHNGIKGTTGGRAKIYYGKNRSLERLMYIVGPYLGTQKQSDESATIDQERASVNTDIAPGMHEISRFLRQELDTSIVYIGFGKFEDSQLPTLQRVRAVKGIVKKMQTLRAEQLGYIQEKTMLLGLSLGGVVGKIALTELESEGYEHAIHSYISFDSPHYGAYIPLSLQRVPEFLNGAFSWAKKGFSWTELFYDNPLDEARDAAARVSELALKNPVSQDILRYNLAFEGWRSPNFDYVRSHFRKLPTKTVRNIAIASGSINYIKPRLRDAYYSIQTGDALPIEIQLNMNPKIPSFKDPSYFSSQLSFMAFTAENYYPEFKRIRYSRSYSLANRLNIIEDYERAPCSYAREFVPEMVNQLNAELKKNWDYISVTATEKHPCFIPTHSAVVGSYSRSNGWKVDEHESAFDIVIGGSENKAHMEIDDSMLVSIKSYLRAFQAPGLQNRDRTTYIAEPLWF